MPDWERNENRTLIIILAAVIVAVIAVLGVIGLRRYRSDKASQQEMRQAAAEHNEAMQEARIRKEELQSRLDELNEQSRIELQKMGSVLFLCTEPDTRVYSDVKTIVEEAGFKGIVAVSEDHFPGTSGCMSMVLLKDMQEEGWNVVVAAGPGEKPEMNAGKLKKEGITADGLYYPNGINDNDEALKLAEKLGVEAVLTYSQDENFDGNKVCRFLTLGCSESGIKNVTDNIISASDTIVLSIGFVNPREQFEETSVTNMVAYIKKHADNGDTVVADIPEAVSRKRKVEKLRQDARDQNENERLVIEAKIEELDRILLSGETAPIQETPAKPTVALLETEELVIEIQNETEVTKGEPEAEQSSEEATEESETETTAESKTTAAGTSKAATAAAETTQAKVSETVSAAPAPAAGKESSKKPKKTGKTPAAAPEPEIEETPGDVYVEPETEPTGIYSKNELESGTNWPAAEYDIQPAYGPGLETTAPGTP